jgi:hypothetical protein
MYASTLIILCLAGYISFLLFYPVNSLEVIGSPTVTKQTYYPGDIVEYTAHLCIKKEVTYTLTTHLIDGTNYPYPDELIHRNAGCLTVTKNNIIIPITQKPGRYHLEFNIRIQENVLRSQDELYRTQDFDILPIFNKIETQGQVVPQSQNNVLNYLQGSQQAKKQVTNEVPQNNPIVEPPKQTPIVPQDETQQVQNDTPTSNMIKITNKDPGGPQ